MYKSQLEILRRTAEIELRPEETIKIHDLKEVWSAALQRTTYSSMLADYVDGVCTAYAITIHGQRIELAVEEDWSTGSGQRGHEPAATVGEQLARAGRVAYIITHSRYCWGGENRSWADIYVGPGAPSRYLRWRIMKSARELCGLIDELEPLCPQQRPAAGNRSRQRLLEAAGQ